MKFFTYIHIRNTKITCNYFFLAYNTSLSKPYVISDLRYSKLALIGSDSDMVNTTFL